MTLLAPYKQRAANLRAALGFLQVKSKAPELTILHRWLDTWTGLGLVAVGVERQGLRFSLSHIAEGEWRGVHEQPDVRAGGIRSGGNTVAGGAA